MRRRSIVFLLLLVSSCLWSRYGDILAVHVDVLLGMADKLVSKSEAGGRATPSDVTELVYPLQRARQFARSYEARSSQASYRALLVLLDRYEEMAEAIDTARGDEDRWSALRADLPARLEVLKNRAAEVRRALRAEGW